MTKFNDWLAEKITIGFATMWCVYLFAVYGLSPLLFPKYITQILYWSNYIQLVALPALLVGQFVIAKKQEKKNQAIFEAQEKRAQETHDTVMAALAEIKDTHAEETEEIVELKEIVNLLKS